VAVGRDLARREQVRSDRHDVRRGPQAGRRLGGGRLERRGAGGQGRAAEDDDDGRRRHAELALEQIACTGGFEVGEAEAAGPKRRPDARRERDGDEQDDRPGRDDPPAAPVREPAEAAEDGRGQR